LFAHVLLPKTVTMHPIFARPNEGQPVPILFVTAANFDKAIETIDDRERTFLRAAGYAPKPGRYLAVPAADGKLAGILFSLENADEPVKDLFRPGQLSGLLPPGMYRFANAPHDARLAALSFALGAYQFTRYRKADARNARLVVPDGVDGDDLTRIVEGVTLARDLINTPSNDMGPAELEDAAHALAKQHGAAVQIISGDALAKYFPLVHAVGAGSPRAPRLIDITWGKDSDPKITLVGKGVCFDTGGLDIKNDAGMLNMKKDMAGGATALALAHMIMARKLKVRLRVIIPAVENSISGTSFRPRDIYTSRKGISVEIGNTDAEGRLILADALTLADEDKPALVVDFATLTGAARVALGPEVPPFFTDDDALAGELAARAASENDPLWRMPLWRPYEAMLDSKVADFNNVATGGHGGAITAALFLRKFIAAKSWLHLDIFAWTPTAKPGRPEGAECQSARALYALLCARYS
jgi:leucyl aminopeptidase